MEALCRAETFCYKDSETDGEKKDKHFPILCRFCVIMLKDISFHQETNSISFFGVKYPSLSNQPIKI